MVVEEAGGLDKQWATELKTPVAQESDAREDNCENLEEPVHSDGLGNSCGLAVAGAIRNPIVLPIRTASERDPCPGRSTCTITTIDECNNLYMLAFGGPPITERNRVDVDAQNSKNIVLKSISRERAHLVVEYLWLPEFGAQLAYHRIPMATLNTRLGKYCLSSWSRTKRAAGVGSPCGGNGCNSVNRRKITQVAAETRTGDRAQDTSINALFPAMTGPDLRDRIGGRQVWDQGGGKAESLYLAERYMNRRENWAGQSTPENEKEELAGRQALGF